jgi:hypothetical protein
VFDSDEFVLQLAIFNFQFVLAQSDSVMRSCGFVDVGIDRSTAFLIKRSERGEI